MATITYLQTASSAADASTYTFSAQNLGTASSDRYIIVTIGSRKSGASAHVTGVSIGGVPATIVVDNPVTATNTGYSGIAIASVPSGTAADIAVTFSGTMVRCTISAYAATGIDSTPYSTVTAGAASIATGGSLSVVSGGVSIGAASNSSNTVFTWTGLTKDYDNNETGESTYRWSSASLAETSTTSKTVSVSASSTTEASLSVVHFQPVAVTGSDLVGVGTTASGSGDILAVYINATNKTGTSSSPPNNVVVSYNGETLSNQTYGGQWIRLSTPSTGWDWNTLKELQVSGAQYGSYSTVWTDTSLMVISKSSSSSPNFLFFFNGL